jgi:hypothetical protein
MISCRKRNHDQVHQVRQDYCEHVQEKRHKISDQVLDEYNDLFSVHFGFKARDVVYTNCNFVQQNANDDEILLYPLRRNHVESHDRFAFLLLAMALANRGICRRDGSIFFPGVLPTSAFLLSSGYHIHDVDVTYPTFRDSPTRVDFKEITTPTCDSPIGLYFAFATAKELKHVCDNLAVLLCELRTIRRFEITTKGRNLLTTDIPKLAKMIEQNSSLSSIIVNEAEIHASGSMYNMLQLAAAKNRNVVNLVVRNLMYFMHWHDFFDSITQNENLLHLDITVPITEAESGSLAIWIGEPSCNLLSLRLETKTRISPDSYFVAFLSH